MENVKHLVMDANGYVRSEGVGVILLKPLQQAVLDGDHVYGVIKSSAVNHGGKSNFFNFSKTLNHKLPTIEAAYKNFQIDPSSISYIETHGTGTAIGDPVEINGLKKAFQRLGVDTINYCALGAVKSNIGPPRKCFWYCRHYKSIISDEI